MPWSSRKSRKLATNTSLTLGLIAGFSINLLTSWFQQYILSNILLLIFVVVVLVGIGYYVIFEIRSALLTSAFIVLVFTIFFNLFSPWFLEHILHSLFTKLSVTLILSATIILLVLSYYIGSHPINNYMRKTRYKLRRKAKLASKEMVDISKKPNIKKRMPTSRQRKRRF